MGAIHALDMLGRSYMIELVNGERLHFIGQACEFDELFGFDEEMNHRRLLISDISTARRNGKEYGRIIMDMVAIYKGKYKKGEGGQLQAALFDG